MNSGKKPLLSIVIANYEYGRFLGRAIGSVLMQCDEPVCDERGHISLPIKGRMETVELVVCDAASKDESVSVIKEFEHCLTWWCSEKDGGQSAAFNKGFLHTEAEWLTWLNADDLLMPGTLVKLAKLAEERPKAQWITGNDLHFDNETKKIIFLSWGPHVVPPFLKKDRAMMYPFGPTSFWRRSVYERIGPIDEKLHYQMDLDYWTRLTMAGVLQTRLNHTCWAFRHHEVAKSTGGCNPAAGKREYEYWRAKTGYTYKVGFKNVWYDIWLMCRLLDGSALVRWWKRRRLIGRLLDENTVRVI